MKIAWIGGNHPRHLYYINKIHEAFPVSYGIMQEREPMIEKKIDDPVIRDHFENRAEAEGRYFTADCETSKPLFPHIVLPKSEIENVQLEADIILVFGCGMLKPLPNMLNMHLGISPRYKGSGTNFWPFYMKEPEYVGATFHKLTEEPDAGDILHQCVPKIEEYDRMQDIMCKAVCKATNDMIGLLNNVINPTPISQGWSFGSPSHMNGFVEQKKLGKTWMVGDIKDEHIKALYPEPKTYKNKWKIALINGLYSQWIFQKRL